MAVSAEKSTLTLFSPWTAQNNVKLAASFSGGPPGALIPTDKNPKVLGFTFDPGFTFCEHAAVIARRAASRIKIIRALADTTFGKDEECLLMTYRALIRSVINYGAPIVYPNYSDSSIQRLQRVQNRGLRLALGCHAASSVDFLHAEAKELLVSQHLRLLSAQYLARALQPHHANHSEVLLDHGPRLQKHTLRSKVIDLVQPYLNEDGLVSPGTFNTIKDSLHKDVVEEAIENMAPNRVLHARPPLVYPNVALLPRITRSTLPSTSAPLGSL